GVLVGVGLVAWNSCSRSATLALEVGREQAWGGHTFELQAVREERDERRQVVLADVVLDGDRGYRPGNSTQLRIGQDIGPPSVRTGPFKDVYLTLEPGAEPGASSATIRVF